MNDIRTILLTTDFSELSARAVPAALLLARRFSAKVLLLHVVEDLLPPLVGEYAAVPLEEVVGAQVERARAGLERFAREHLSAAAGCEIEVRRGIAHLEIARFAVERGADLIVIATHGRGFISHALFGSTAERIVRRSPCPVLTVRGDAGEAEASRG